MKKTLSKLAVIGFLSLAPVTALTIAPNSAIASHCWECKQKWNGQYYCSQTGGEGLTAECVLIGGGSGCYTVGGCVD